METEFITHEQWDNYARRIERENLKKHGRSLSFSGIGRRASACIVDIQERGMVVQVGWRQVMRGNQ